MAANISLGYVSKIIVTPQEFELSNPDGTHSKFSGMKIEFLDDNGKELIQMNALPEIAKNKPIKFEVAETKFIKA